MRPTRSKPEGNVDWKAERALANQASATVKEILPPVEGFTSPGGREFTVGPGEHWERFPDDTCWHDEYPILLDGKPAGKMWQSDAYTKTSDGRSRWHASVSQLRWTVPGGLELPRGMGYDVAAFDTAAECLEAWGRSADQVLDHAEHEGKGY